MRQEDKETHASVEASSEKKEEFHERTGGNCVYRFRSTIEAMWNLLFAGTLSDNITVVMVQIVRQSEVMAALFMVFMAMTNFTLLSMLVGMICEVITNVDQQNKEEVSYESFLLCDLHSL